MKPKRTAEENKPFIAQGLGSLAGVNGLSKGAGAKQASWNMVWETESAISSMGKARFCVLWMAPGIIR